VRIEQLEYIAAVARLGSYRKAAEALHISQPALSESVRSLERELGADLLERSRQGARLSGSGRDLLQHMLTVLDAVDRLRHAAGQQHQTSRVVRIGTVNTATVPLLAPAIRQFREIHPGTQVEVVGGLHADVQRGLLEGSTDLGLVNCLEGDDMPPELETTQLLIGHAVVCLRPDSPLADQPQVTVGDLRSAALIGMRSGYVMHRYLHRLLGDELPVFSYSADGAEMGKLMVAEGLGITVLPDFSVIGDPLERRDVITWRPLAEDRTRVHLVIQRPRSGSPPRAVRDLHHIFVQRARIVGLSLSAWPDGTEPVAKLPASGRASRSRPGVLGRHVGVSDACGGGITVARPA
jgi:DNA-binding transcriptional LysR family regulator